MKVINQIEIGDKVILTRKICMPYCIFEKGDIVTVISIDYQRGYGYLNESGYRVVEAGFDCKLHSKGDKTTFDVIKSEYHSEIKYKTETSNS